MKRLALIVAAFLAILLGLRQPLWAQGSPDMGGNPAPADQGYQPNDNGDQQANPEDQGDKDENASDPDQDQSNDDNGSDQANADAGDTQSDGDAGQ